MEADVVLNGEVLQLYASTVDITGNVNISSGNLQLNGNAFINGEAIQLNANAIQLSGAVAVQCDSREVDVKGPLAGYAFHDRADEANRYVLYANAQKACLWNDNAGNILSIDKEALSVKVIVSETINTSALIADALVTKNVNSKGADILLGNIHTINSSHVAIKGKEAEYSFCDREDEANRFVMYANENKIHFWKDGTGDILTIGGNKVLDTEHIHTKTITADSIVLNAPLELTVAQQHSSNHTSIGDQSAGNGDFVLNNPALLVTQTGRVKSAEIRESPIDVIHATQRIPANTTLNLLDTITDLYKRIAALEDKFEGK